MFFKRRRWALRVTETMGLDTMAPVATELVSMIIQGSEQMAEMMRSTETRIDESGLVLMSAAALRGNQSALETLISACGVNSQEAMDILEQAYRAARKVADKYELHELLASSWFQEN